MKVLVVAAHPDDEVLGCGATIAAHTARGDEVAVLILGEGGTSRTPSRVADDEVVGELASCAREAAARLGIATIDLAGLPDNRFDSVDLLDVAKLVEAAVERHTPEVVYTHHALDLNVDHQRTHAAVLVATRPQPGSVVHSVYAFEVPSSTEWAEPIHGVFRPARFVDVSDVIERKVDALGAYESEMRPFPHSRSIEAVRALATWRGASVGVAAAEAFEVVREVVTP